MLEKIANPKEDLKGDPNSDPNTAPNTDPNRSGNTEIDLNPQFQEALALMENTHETLFITGKAGTGKSTLLDYFCKHTQKNPVVLAPTGVAALNVSGQTLHRFFQFYVDVTPEKIIHKKTKPRNPKLYKKLQTLIIDEVSMLRADLVDCMDVFLRIYGPHSSKPFGGIQMIFVGDLYQLPPVLGREEAHIFQSHYATPYFFSAKALESQALEVVELETVYRQKHTPFVELLNKIRNNSVESEDIKKLNERYAQDDSASLKDAFTLTLTPTNAKADAINATHLESLPGKLYTHTALIQGDFGKEYYPTAVHLDFKVGSQIMLLNNDSKKRWVNGSIGIIEAVAYDENMHEYVKVRLHDTHKRISIYPFMWEVHTMAEEKGALVSQASGNFTQYPFRLAWAVTIHKSQGKTFHRVIIDMGRGAFASGQTYVALSRCTSFEGISLKVPIEKKHIRTDPRIYKFLTSHAYKKALETLPFQKKCSMIQRAIEKEKKLEMTYLKANDSKCVHVITPLTVGEEIYERKTFTGMRAYDVGGEKRMFNVARILDLKEV